MTPYLIAILMQLQMFSAREDYSILRGRTCKRNVGKYTNSNPSICIIYHTILSNQTKIEISRTCYILTQYKGKGKAISLQAWTGPKCSRRLRLPDFKTIGT